MTKNDNPDQWNGEYSIRVENSDDYNRIRRFEEIHDARDAIHRFVQTTVLNHEPGVSFDPAKGAMLARVVSMYIKELISLMEDFDDNDELLSDGTDTNDLKKFAAHTGLVERDAGFEVPPPYFSLRMFSAANLFYRRAGLELKLVDDPGEARFDYSDILDDGPQKTHRRSDVDSESDDRQPGEEV